MAKQYQHSLMFVAGNAFMRSMLALGISLNGSTLITVPGRKTGRPHSTPITMVEFQGQRYVQSPFGSVNWVRNLRAAGKDTLSWGRRRETIVVTELTPEQRAAVIRSILPRAPMVIRYYFDVTPESSVEDIIQDAPGLPMYAVRPA